MDHSEAYRWGASSITQAWREVHAPSSPRFHPLITLPYPAAWPPAPDATWTRYGYAVARDPLPIETTAHGAETQSRAWATVTQRGLDGEPVVEVANAPLLTAGWRAIRDGDDVHPAPPLGAALVRSTTGPLTADDTALVVGAFLRAHAWLTSELLADIEQRHPAFFRWLAELQPRPPWMDVHMEDIFAPRPAPRFGPTEFDEQLKRADEERIQLENLRRTMR